MYLSRLLNRPFGALEMHRSFSKVRISDSIVVSNKRATMFVRMVCGQVGEPERILSGDEYMKYGCILFLSALCLGAIASEQNAAGYYIVDMQPVINGDHMLVHTSPRFVDRKKPVNGVFMSGPLEDVVTFLAQQDDVRYRKFSGAFRFSMSVSVITLGGKTLQKEMFSCELGFGEGPRMMRAGSPMSELQFSFDEVQEPAQFLQLIDVLLKPLKRLPFQIPGEGFRLDLEYRYPRPLIHDLGREFYRDIDTENNGFHLGVSWCEKQADGIAAHNNLHILNFEDQRNAISQAVELGKRGNGAGALGGIKDYLEQVPSDRFFARVLLNMYRQIDPELAKAYAHTWQPLFMTWVDKNPIFLEQSDYNKTDAQLGFHLRRKAMRTRRNNEKRWKKLRAKKEKFPLDPSAWLRIVSPGKDDLAAGKTAVEFVVMEGEINTPVLQIDCFLDNELVGSLDQPPAIFYFDPKSAGKQELRVVAYFENETRCEDTISIETMAVGEQQEVHVSELQVVALGDGGRPGELQDDLQIMEKGEAAPISRIWRDEKDLDVVVLIDTSRSMRPHIHKAQQAVHHFLSKLRDGESASVYTYDQKVLRIKRFEGDLVEATPHLLTLQPQGLTALHDALLTAQCELMDRGDATKTIILIGDGADTASSTSLEEIRTLLGRSPIRVYSIQLVSKGSSWDKLPRYRLMSDLAEQSGGIHKKTHSGEVGQTLDMILAELRELYFVSFHTKTDRTERGDLSVKAPGQKLRWLQVGRQQ